MFLTSGCIAIVTIYLYYISCECSAVIIHRGPRVVKTRFNTFYFFKDNVMNSVSSLLCLCTGSYNNIKIGFSVPELY